MAALLVALAVMSLMLSMTLPVWHHAAQREREAELIFRGEQYARAIMLYQRQTPGAYSPAVEGRFLRRAYRDPMTAGGEFRLILQSELVEFSGLGAVGGAADDGEPKEAGDGPRRQRQGEDVRDRPGFMQGVRPFANRGERTPGGVDGNIAGVVSRSEENFDSALQRAVAVQRLGVPRRGPPRRRARQAASRVSRSRDCPTHSEGRRAAEREPVWEGWNSSPQSRQRGSRSR